MRQRQLVLLLAALASVIGAPSNPAEALTIDVSFFASDFGSTGSDPDPVPQSTVTGLVRLSATPVPSTALFVTSEAVSLEIAGITYSPLDVGAILDFDASGELQTILISGLLNGGGMADAQSASGGTDDFLLIAVPDAFTQFTYTTASTTSLFQSGTASHSVSIVPEPSTALLVSGGLLLLGAQRRRVGAC